MSGSAPDGGAISPVSSCFAVTFCLYIFLLASGRSPNMLNSNDTPQKTPRVLEYANIPAVPLFPIAPMASALRPTGPRARDTLPPRVIEPL